MLIRVLKFIVFNFISVAMVVSAQVEAEATDVLNDASTASEATSMTPSKASVMPDVVELFTVALEKKIGTESVNYIVSVSASMDEVDVPTAAIVAHVKDSLGGSKLYTLKAKQLPQKQAVWLLNVPALKQARYTVKLRANVKTPAGERASGNLPAQFFTYPAEGDPIFYPADDKVMKLREELAEKLAETPEQYNDKLDKAESKQAAGSAVDVSMVKPDEAIDTEEGASSWFVIIGSVLGLVVVCAAGFFTYRLIKKRKEGALEEFDIAASPEAPQVTTTTESTTESSKATTTPNDTQKPADVAPDEPSDAIDISEDDLMADLDAAFTMETEEDTKKPEGG